MQEPTGGTSQTTGPKDVTADYKIPFDVSVGLEYKVTDALSAYLDGSYQASSTYDTGEGVKEDNKAAPRGSLGFSYLVNSTINLFAGVAYNPSSVNTSLNDYAEDYIETTLGTRWSSSNTNLGVGLMYAQSSGSKPSAIYDYLINQIGTKTADVNTRAFGLMLSSGYIF